ncbi:GntR family transcriptional regulator [Paenibacillus sacheonensis]|uniref:GntR family transcriptional regulator n=1 Tax=Paenibacillus sacheonensis TaxID=742054 RepID=A0A7X5BX72_9BACL|nr:GntR family transcriptional regulator [Paenibacillus sacheonensis]MBM7563154.1 DNA-binding LacI/PurR family transcriptional regulator [Paenibacillus sacheonensis]NBC68282.1 GntR family transcriptional regulator [Paenibacillus sacheonensis]
MALYLKLKDEIVRLVLNGTFKSGSLLPTEHELCARYELSRVTVRKALEELKKDGLLVSVQGQGTAVSVRAGGYASSMEIIALIAPVHNPFFASFMAHFEEVAETNGSLVLFKQDFSGRAFATDDFFYRLIKNGIRNVVFWPQSEDIDFGMLHRLRAVGMNMVIFDQMFETDAADTVGIDSGDAVAKLYASLRTAIAGGEIAFLGYEGLTIPSERQREQAFRALNGDGGMFRIPWGKNVEAETAALLRRLQEEGKLPSGFICCNGPIGLAAAEYMAQSGIEGIRLAVIDELPEMANYRLAAYRQPMKEMAEKTYERLAAQNKEGDGWRAGRFPVKGSLIDTRRDTARIAP